MFFTAMFMLAMVLIKVQESTNDKSGLTPKGKLIIHLSWDPKSNTDLDLWARTDNPVSIVSFRQTDSSNMWLDHDSRGAASNKVKMADGTYKTTFGNDEIIQFKECTKTRVTVNVHAYHLDLGLPVAATVDIILPPSYKTIHTAQLDIKVNGQESTAFSFDLDEDCNVSNFDDTLIPFVYSVITPNSSTLPGSPPYEQHGEQ